MQHISDMHSKFALRPHHVSKYGLVDIQSATAEIRRGIKKERQIETTGKNTMSASAAQGGHECSQVEGRVDVDTCR